LGRLICGGNDAFDVPSLMDMMTTTTTPTAAATTRTWITEISDTCDFGLFNLPLGTCSFVVVDKLRSEEKHKVREKQQKC